MDMFESFILKIPVLLFTISNMSAGLLLVVAVTMLFIIYRIYRSSINSNNYKNDALIRQMQGLQQQFDYASRLEIKSRAEAERAAAARDKLLSSISHEIRTPMNGILGMTVLLQETNLSTEQKEYIDTIISSGKILLGKVNEVMASDILDHSKINVVSTTPEHNTVDIRNCIEEVLQMFAVKASDSGLDLLYEIDPDVPTQIIGDDKRLHQVLINLVEIVIDDAKQQEIFVGVHLLTDEITKITTLGIEVSDERIGSEKKIQQQFLIANKLKDFVVEEEQDSQVLGLAIAKKLVEEMGGELRTMSNVVNAVNFIFSIPLNIVNRMADNSAGYTMKGFEGVEVLIVSNSITAAGIIKNQLNQWKLVATIATTGKQAIEMLAMQNFSMVVTAIEMPDINGFELCKVIKQKYPKLPLILLNPLNDEILKQHEEIIEEISVLSKPVKQHQLFDTILTALLQLKRGGNASDFSVKKLTVEFSNQYPLRILVAEDNPVNQKWAIKILNKMGYQPAVAENGHMALEMVGQADYDLILMDVQMSEMDGIEATKMIRVCLQKQPVIIAMTANVMHGDRQACMQAGMDDYISKPVELGELVSMLQKWALVISEKNKLL